MSRLSSVLKSPQPTGQKARAIQSCHPSISRGGQPCHQAKGESGDSHSSVADTKSSGSGDTYSFPLQGWQEQPCPTFTPQQERPKFLHPSQLPLLRTSQIQLRDEVKNSCDGVRRGVQSPRTQATAGNQLGAEAQEPAPPGQYPGDSSAGGQLPVTSGSQPLALAAVFGSC